MGRELRTAAISAASHFALFVAAISFSIFGLDRYEAAWGPARTWEVLCWLGAGSAVLVFFGAMFGSILAGRTGRALRPAHAVLAGAATAMLLIVLLYLRQAFGMEGGLFFAVVGSMLVPFAMALALSRPR